MRIILLLITFLGLCANRSHGADALTLFPTAITLDGKSSRQQLLLSETLPNQTRIDRTRDAVYQSETPNIVQVTAAGVVTSVADGEGSIRITHEGRTISAKVQVKNALHYPPVTFERDIQPLLTRYGCNQGACHGKARGQNGFALSLLGFDSESDYHAIVSEGRGRRLFPANPDMSFLLLKASARVAHGGGKKLSTDDPSYQRLLRWIEAGCPRTPATTASLVKVTVEPSERSLTFQEVQQLAVTAHYSNGSREDVTHLSTFQSNESVFAAVNERGQIKAGPLPGEATIMARYMEKFALTQVMIPLPGQVPAADYAKLPRLNFIDGLVYNKLQRLGIAVSEPANDATFHRRAYLDVIGRLPTPQETRSYLADTDPLKQTKLIDGLLARPEYADFWANKWADLLRPNPYRVGIKAVYNLDAFLRESFRSNKPYDQFVRELITAQGSTFRNGATVMLRDRREPDEITTMVSQIFLGIRLDCAKCHHHPFEVYAQEDFYAFAAYFSRIGRRGQGISAPISGLEEIIFSVPSGEVKHPLTGEVMKPRPLFGTAPEVTAENDPRQIVADWMTAPENPYFGRVIVNRIWADLMGRGFVDPVDDLRATNPASNPELIDALATDFRKNGNDLKKLIRTIMLSHVYRLSSTPVVRNVGDLRNYSRHYRERLRGEVLLDAISDITGVGESFSAMPPGSRALAVWTVRTESVFLDSFGRPDPNQDPPCERTPETSVVQALHLMNAPNVTRKITDDKGRCAELARSKETPTAIIEELYLRIYCRPPTAEETKTCLKRFERTGAIRQHVIEDIMWALLNTPEFVFKD